MSVTSRRQTGRLAHSGPCHPPASHLLEETVDEVGAARVMEAANPISDEIFTTSPEFSFRLEGGPAGNRAGCSSCLEAEALRDAPSAIHNVCEQLIRDLCHGCGSAQDQVSGAPKKRLDVREIRKHLAPLCRFPSVRV
jgi:hypothetical protein